jgi:uncharacterized protein YdhG (YjbR/CyaY superfamily)
MGRDEPDGLPRSRHFARFYSANLADARQLVIMTPTGRSRMAAKWHPNNALQTGSGPMTARGRATQVATVDDYIAASAKEVQPILRKLRTTIRRAVPQAKELISYRMPAYNLNGIIMYFAAFKRHIGVFPPVRGTAALVKAVKPYAGPKGNLKFPVAKPIPYRLIAQIAKQRVQDNQDQAAIKKATTRSQKARRLRDRVSPKD